MDEEERRTRPVLPLAQYRARFAVEASSRFPNYLGSAVHLDRRDLDPFWPYLWLGQWRAEPYWIETLPVLAGKGRCRPYGLALPPMAIAIAPASLPSPHPSPV
jgi:hypothetical protein